MDERLREEFLRSARARFAELPQIVAVIDQAERHAVGLTVEGVPVELVVAEPSAFGTALVRATGSPDYVSALEPLPEPFRTRLERPRRTCLQRDVAVLALRLRLALGQ